MDVCECPHGCLDVASTRSTLVVLDAPCAVAGWVHIADDLEPGCVGGPGSPRSRADRRRPAALPPEEQVSGWCSRFAVRAAGAGCSPVSPFERPGDQDTGSCGDGAQNLSPARTRTFHDRGPVCPDTALEMWPA